MKHYQRETEDRSRKKKKASEQHIQHDIREREKEGLLKWQEGEGVKVRHWCTALAVSISLERRRVLDQVDNTSQRVKIWFWGCGTFLLPSYFISHIGFTQKKIT